MILAFSTAGDPAPSLVPSAIMGAWLIIVNEWATECVSGDRIEWNVMTYAFSS